MALTKVNRGGLNTGISDSSDATFLTATSSEGVTLAGTLAVTGVHTVGTNAVATSDGGAATTSIVQGLAKSWSAVNGSGTIAILDSFNTASISDAGEGVHEVTYTSAMSNDDYAAAVSHQESQRNNAYGSHATTSIRTFSRSDGGTFSDVAHKSVIIHGDLA